MIIYTRKTSVNSSLTLLNFNIQTNKTAINSNKEQKQQQKYYNLNGVIGTAIKIFNIVSTSLDHIDSIIIIVICVFFILIFCGFASISLQSTYYYL